jgi:predicted alpha-1,2-mannosidase
VKILHCTVFFVSMRSWSLLFMKTFSSLWILAWFTALGWANNLPASESIRPADPVDCVDPFIGTTSGGNVFAGATLPFGFVQPGPDTGPGSGASGYDNDKPINGFSQQHISGLGGPIYGEISLMPVTGQVPEPSDVCSSGKSLEAASPGYYAVTLAPWNVKAELTCTEHVAFHRYTFPASSQSRILLNLGHCLYGTGPNWGSAKPVGGEVKIDSEQREVSGFMVYAGGRSTEKPWKVYFVARFDAPFATFSPWSDKGWLPQGVTSAQGANIGMSLNFVTTAGQVIQSKIAISWRSIEQARSRFERELPGWNFDTVHEAARIAWRRVLERIEIDGGSANNRRLFYTALYHMHLAPNNWTGESPERYGTLTYYENQLCLWDTFRGVMPLYTLIEPKVSADIVNTLLNFYTVDGWTGDAHSAHQYEHVQNGSNADVVIADAYAKGLPGVDWSKAFQAIRKNAFEDPDPKANSRPKTGRFRLTDYLKHGYLPTDVVAYRDVQGVTRTLEYVYDDFCVLSLARTYGTAGDAQKLAGRILWYQNLWDAPSGGFMRGRTTSGSWFEPFDPLNGDTGKQFYEGHAWTWMWCVPHDEQGLINLLGGDDAFVKKLSAACEQHYEAYNEPGLLQPYLFIHAGRPDLTQHILPDLMKNFTTASNGLPGNDDSGAISGWLVWTMLGLYPNAGQDYYYLSRPTFPRVTIHLENGHKLVISAPGATTDNRYIASARLDDRPWNQAWIRHRDLINASSLDFETTAVPTPWGRNPRPPSVSVAR